MKVVCLLLLVPSSALRDSNKQLSSKQHPQQCLSQAALGVVLWEGGG